MVGMENFQLGQVFFLASMFVSLDSVLSLESVFFVVILAYLGFTLDIADVDASPNIHWIC